MICNRKLLSVLTTIIGVMTILTHLIFANENDLRILLDGVKVINAAGLPGPVCVFGDNAFAVVVGGVKGGAYLPLVAASRFGKGRVVAFGKDGFLDVGNLALGDTGRLMTNAIHWASGKTGVVTVGVYKNERLAKYFTKQGLTAKEINLDQLDEVDVLCVRPNQVQDKEIERLSRFVAAGKGLIAAELGWGWLQLHPGKTLTTDNRANRLLAPMGIVWADGMVNRTSKSGYVCGESPSPLTNASKALDAASAYSKGEMKLTAKEIVQISTTLSRTVQALPPNDTILLSRIHELIKHRKINVVPTRKRPIKSSDILARLILTMQIQNMKRLPAEKIQAHPAAKVFPGSVPADALEVTRSVSINTAIPNWHSTGLYAAPGKLITVTVPESAAGRGLKVRIGSTTCRNWHHSKWLRAPEITREFDIRKPQTKAANAFGGLVYIVVPSRCKLGTISVTIAGCVEAPFYELGKTTLEEWRSTVRKRPAPWAELASTKAILTVPSKDVRNLDDPESLMKLWDRILDTCAELAAWKSKERKRPERYVADVQLCAGYMHAGYPIMIPVSAAPKLLDREHLLKEGDWGLYHETGHNHQYRDWTFGGTGEVTVNLFTLYVLDKICGIKPEKGRMTQGGIKRSVIHYFAKGCPFDEWKRKPFLALVMYFQMQQGFGWDAFKKVFAEYRDLPKNERPKNDDEKRDQWLVRFSRTVGRNLGPFFEAWGIPTSDKARASIENLPVWMPKNFPPRGLKKDRIAKNARVINVDSEERGDEGSNVVDGFNDTIWHTKWRGDNVPSYPHEIVIDLSKSIKVKGITVLPRQDGSNGWVKRYEVYVSQDGKRWGKPIVRGAFERTKDKKNVLFQSAIVCRYIRFVALEGFDRQPWASMAEMDIISPN